MNDPIGFVVCTIGLIFLLIYTYFIWVKPQTYLEFSHKRKSKLKKDYPFIPNWFLSYVFYFDKPKLIIWVVRIAVLWGLIICTMGMIVSIRGPF